MAKVRDWENYLDDEFEEERPKIRKFKDREERPTKKKKA